LHSPIKAVPYLRLFTAAFTNPKYFSVPLNISYSLWLEKMGVEFDATITIIKGIKK